MKFNLKAVKKEKSFNALLLDICHDAFPRKSVLGVVVSLCFCTRHPPALLLVLCVDVIVNVNVMSSLFSPMWRPLRINEILDWQLIFHVQNQPVFILTCISKKFHFMRLLKTRLKPGQCITCMPLVWEDQNMFLSHEITCTSVSLVSMDGQDILLKTFCSVLKSCHIPPYYEQVFFTYCP